MYCEYKHPLSVAVAILGLYDMNIRNGIKLRCSFGTSKYCSHFLGDHLCEANHMFLTFPPKWNPLNYSKNKCPFVHELERRRTRVIQDDEEFQFYVKIQERVAFYICAVFGLIPNNQWPKRLNFNGSFPSL